MKTIRTTLTKLYKPRTWIVAGVLAGVVGAIGCTPNIEEATPAQAVLARATITEGQQKVQENVNSILTNFPPPPATSK